MSHRKQTTIRSRQITTALIWEVVADHPSDTLAYLQARTGASEAQCIIALRRDTRRRHIVYRPDTDTYAIHNQPRLTSRAKYETIRG